MKRIIVVSLLLICIVSLCACTGAENNATTAATSVTPATSATSAQAVTVAESTVSSGIDEITDNNVKQMMAKLMPRAEEIFGYVNLGLIEVGDYNYETAYTDSENGCKYTPVIDESLNTVAKVKALCESYYTKSYCEAELYGAFDGPYELYKEIDGVLCLNIDAGGGGGDTYITETSQIVSQDSGSTVVTMSCRDSYDGEYIATVTLKLVDGSYRIDSIQTTEA